MKVLFISRDLIAGDLAYQLKKEGHEVKLFIEDKDRKTNFVNIVPQASNWRKEIDWVGKDGLIIFDDVGYGKEQEELRRKGYVVFGGCHEGDLLESDRVFGDKIFRKYGLSTYPMYNFKSIEKAISFLESNEGPWVIKQNDLAPKSLNYVGTFKDNRDVIKVLQNYKKNFLKYCKVITLHKKIEGIEIAVSRFFNGNKWIGPIEVNIEHKKFLSGNVGPTTSEMGTIAWYDSNENNKLFINTLVKLEPFLKKINYRGVIDINCIVNETGAHPLEATARFGSPIVHLQSEVYFNQWKNDIGNFFYNIAAGNEFTPLSKNGFGMVILLAVPPFPYSKKMKGISQYGQTIYFNNLSPEEFKHVHFEEVSYKKKDNEYYISDDRGYILYVTTFGESMDKAQEDAYKLINKIHFPMMLYRNDVGTSFIKKDMIKLKELGYL